MGEGWAPAILNHIEDLDTIRHEQPRSFSDDRSYWIGGSTAAQPWSLIDFDQYKKDDSGNQVLSSSFPRMASQGLVC